MLIFNWAQRSRLRRVVEAGIQLYSVYQ